MSGVSSITKGGPMKTSDQNAEKSPLMSMKELAALGSDDVAYIKIMSSQEVMEKFPMVEGLQPGIKLWALFSASGDPIALSDEPDSVFSNAMELELNPVSVH